MRKLSVFVVLFILCMTLSTGNLYAACTITRGKIEVSQGTGSSCSSIQSAINEAGGINPVIISVLPGTYTETITMKSNIHLQGAGRDVTIIYNSNIYNNSGISNVTISGFKLSDVYVSNNSSSPVIKDNIFTGNGGWATIENTSASPIIEGNIFKDIANRAILSRSSSAIIKNNIISNTGNWVISEWSSSSTIIGNVIEGAGDGLEISNNSSTKIIGNIMRNGYRGMQITDGGQVIVKDNVITGSSNEDINCGAPVLISSNVYSTFVGSGAFGNYNLKPDGTPAPLQ